MLQPFLEALDSLLSNKLRSGLTILGIVIGVGAVIALISIGRGAEATITDSIQSIGTNLLFVFRGGSSEVRNPQPMPLPSEIPSWPPPLPVWLQYYRVVAWLPMVGKAGPPPW
jgi:hypothetical protein